MIAWSEAGEREHIHRILYLTHCIYILKGKIYIAHSLFPILERAINNNTKGICVDIKDRL